ncbi:MAG: radical SAM protein [Calditrichaeota bacterium]|nr:radical SAM protein [Calditrichota bacterium]MBT7789804.1 radical SAM protein [Calditrichota bacterium]
MTDKTIDQLVEGLSEKAERRFRLLREGKTKIVCRSIWLLITRKCPFECRHCYFCGSPNGESMTVDQVERVVNNLPTNLETLGISGGEPFTNPKLLKKTLEFIQTRNFPHLTNLTVQTLGFWARDRKRTISKVSELIDLGVNSFYVYGNDSWHIEQGLNPQNPELLVDVLANEFGAIEPEKMMSLNYLFDRDTITYSTRKTGQILPIGRGKWGTTENEWQRVDTNPVCPCRDFLKLNPNGYHYIVNFNGEVHFCLYQTAPSLGNIFERPLTQILKNARRRDIFQIMNRGDVREFASEITDNSQQVAEKAISERGRCIYCIDLLEKHFENRTDKPVLYSVFEKEKCRSDS